MQEGEEEEGEHLWCSYCGPDLVEAYVLISFLQLPLSIYT